MFWAGTWCNSGHHIMFWTFKMFWAGTWCNSGHHFALQPVSSMELGDWRGMSLCICLCVFVFLHLLCMAAGVQLSWDAGIHVSEWPFLQNKIYQIDPTRENTWNTNLFWVWAPVGCFVHVEGNMRLEASTWCNYGHPNSGGHLGEGHIHLDGHRHYIGANDSKNLHNSSTGHWLHHTKEWLADWMFKSSPLHTVHWTGDVARDTPESRARHQRTQQSKGKGSKIEYHPWKEW